MRHSCRKLFAQKNFRLLKGRNTPRRYVSCPPGTNVPPRHGSRGVRQPVRFFGSRIGSTDLAQYYRVDAVFKPANLGCSFPISTLLATCRFTAVPALPGRMKREPKDGKRLWFASNKVVGNARKIAIQLVKETLLDETETGSWSAHAKHEHGRPKLRIRIARPYAVWRRFKLLLRTLLLRKNLLCPAKCLRLPSNLRTGMWCSCQLWL